MSNNVLDKINIALMNNGMAAEDLVKGEPNLNQKTLYTRYKQNLKPDQKYHKIGGTKFSVEDVYKFLQDVESESQYADVPLALTISLIDIEEGLRSIGKPKWSMLEREDKLDVLWEMGMDVKRNKPYFTKKCRHTRLNGKQDYGIAITGTERCDKEWLNSGYASDDAKLFSKDHTLVKELQEIGRRS